MREKKPDLMLVLTILVVAGVLVTTTLQAVATHNANRPPPGVEQVTASVDTISFTRVHFSSLANR